MRISDTVREYRKAARWLNVKSYVRYERLYKNLNRRDKKLCSMITARIARREIIERRAKMERKNNLTIDEIAQAMQFRSMIKASRRGELNQFIPLLQKIINGIDVYEEIGVSAPQVIKSIKQMIIQGALK